MAVATYTALANYYKIIYSGSNLENATFGNTQFWKAVKKVDYKAGLHEELVIKHKARVGTYRKYAASRQLSGFTSGGPSNPDLTKFKVKMMDNYSDFEIEAKAMVLSSDNKKAWAEAKKEIVDDCLEDHRNKLGRLIWGNGGGHLTKAASVNTTTNVFTCNPVADAYKFHIGMKLDVADPDDYTTEVYVDTTGMRGLVLTVTGVNRQTGVITYSGTDTAFANGDYLFIYGDAALESASETTAQFMSGVAAWIPSVTTGLATENFMEAGAGARDTDHQALAGWRQSWTGLIEETVKNLDVQMARYSTDVPLAGWMSFANISKLEMELQGRVTRDDGKDALFGLPGLVYNSPRGRIKFMGDTYLDDTKGYLLDMSTWEVRKVGGLPHFCDEDGMMLRQSLTQDGVYGQVRSWAQLVCTKPIRNGVFLLA